MGTIGKRIREERERQNIRAGDFAARAALTFDKLSKIEHDKRQVSGTELYRIASALEIAPETLLNERPEVMYRGDPDKPKVAEARRVLERFAENCLTAERLAWLHADSD